MTGTKRVLNRSLHDEIYETKTVTVSGTGTTAMILSNAIHGRKGTFTVNNAGANTVTVFPRVSNDEITWYEMDNGSGTAVATTVTKHFPWEGNYKYVKLDGTAAAESVGVVSTIYVASI